MYKHICLKCGKEFFNTKQHTKFCSRECYLSCTDFKKLKQTKQKNLVEVKCAECGKIEYVSPSRAKKYKCCSRECIGKYNSRKYSEKVVLTCPICGEKYECQRSKINHHRTCGNKSCSSAWRSMTRQGKNNSNYKSVEDVLHDCRVNGQDKSKKYKNDILYKHIVKETLGLKSIKEIPKGYVIHHKDANHFNNDPENIVVLPKSAHRLIHTIFGNILINALHTGKIDKDLFFDMCNDEQKEFYKEIIDLNVKHQVVVNSDELIDNDCHKKKQSIYKNIICIK